MRSIHSAPAVGRAAAALDLVASKSELVVVLQLLSDLQVACRIDDNMLIE